MSLRRRLERLEGGSGRPCPECGIRPDEIPEIVVELPTSGATPEELPRETGSVRCERCGRFLVVDWDDAPTPEEYARAQARMFEHAREHPELHRLSPRVPDYPPDPWPSEAEGEGGGS